MAQDAAARPPLRREVRMLWTASLVLWFAASFLGAILVPSVVNATVRVRISATKTDMRTLHLLLQEHHGETGTYPPGFAFAGPIDDVTCSQGPAARIAGLTRQSDYGPLRVEAALAGPIAWLMLAMYVVGLLGWSWLYARRGRTKRGVPLRGIPLWLMGGLCFLLPVTPFVLGVIGAVVFGVASLPSIPWFWMEARAGYGNRRSLALPEALVMVIFPYLFGCKLIGLAVAQVLVAHLAAQQPPAPKSYHYATDGETCFVIQATGPDGVHDQDLATLIDDGTEDLVRFVEGVWNKDALVVPFYDPSNGTSSGGDIFRGGP